MELNREQAIDILERFDSSQGQRAGRELWNVKPLDVQEQDIAIFSRDVALLKDYIKELTEENERLRANNKQIVNDNAELKNQIQEEIAEEDINLFDEFSKLLHEGIREAKADTVRKMQTEIKKTFSAICKGEMVDLYRIIDQIAKEMLEEGK